MTPPTPRLRPVPLPLVPGNPPIYSPVLPSPPASSAVDLHPLLKPSPSPQIYYDLSLPPNTIIFKDHKPESVDMLKSYATSPAMTCIRVIPPTTPSWPIMVFNPAGVTVFDVLDAIYHSLHTPASLSAWDDLDLPQVVATPPLPVRSHSHDLPRTPPSTPKLEASRRVDHLHGRTQFLGLEKGPDGPETWVLYTIGDTVSA